MKLKQPERRDQILLINYARNKYPGILTIISPIAMFAGSKGAQINQALVRKQMGYMSGTPDVFFPYPVAGYHGLFIEMKKEAGGKISPEQTKMLNKLIDLGYCAVVCKGYEQAVIFLNGYMNGQLKTIEAP